MKPAIIYTWICAPILGVCIQGTPAGGRIDPHTGLLPVIDVREEGPSNRTGIADSLCEIGYRGMDIEQRAWEKCGEYTVVFDPKDFAPGEIVCDNLFSAFRNGRDNPEIQALYDAAGEQWEYLWYVEYDYDGDGAQDYVVLHGCVDIEGMENIGGGDVWLDRDFRRRIALPRAAYLTGGTWEEPQLALALLYHIYFGVRDTGIPTVAVYRNSEKSEMALYEWYGSEDRRGRYRRVRAATVTEKLPGVKVVQTGFPVGDGGIEYVWLQLIREDKGRSLEQTVPVCRVRGHLQSDESNCTAWDGNDDGYEDILYYAGCDGGSGGTWNIYYLLCWSEKEQRYVCMELPWCNIVDYEKHKLYSWGQCGAPEPWYEIYGLQDGEYRLEKELYFHFGGTEDTVTYSEYGVAVEELDITDAGEWKEILIFLKEKYPDFSWISEFYG